MNFAVKLPLIIEQNQELSLDGQSKILNWTYNHLLEIANQKKEEWKKTQDPELAKVIYTKTGLRNLLPALKKEKTFLSSVHSVPLKNAALRLSQAIQSFQKDWKKPKETQAGRGWPKFRSSKKKFFSLLWDEYGNGFHFQRDSQNHWFLELSLGVNENNERLKHRIHIKEMPSWLSQTLIQAEEEYPKKRMALSKEERGKFHIRKLLPFTELRVKKEGSQWFATLSVKRETRQEPTKIQKVAVIDPNHKNLGYLVDSEGQAIEIANLSHLKTLDKRIDEIKKRRDHCKRNSVQVTREDGSTFYRPSRKWKFFQDYLDELHRLRRDQTKSSLYTIANQLTKDYDLIAVGDYAPRGGGISTGMRRAMNNRSQIGKFKQTLKWVCQRDGKTYYEWDEKDSTKTCHQCGTKTQLTRDPSVRHWKCEICNLTHIRDENAAQNGSKLTLEWMKQNNLPCSGHREAKVKGQKSFSVVERWAWCFNGSGITVSRANEWVESQRQEIQTVS